MGTEFIVYVDGMDGDVIQGFTELNRALKRAFDNGAKKVVVELFRQ